MVILVQDGVCNRRVARVGLLSWNVGGISDHRKDQGAGLEEAAQAAVAEVLQAAVACIGEAEIIVVGLQEGLGFGPFRGGCGGFWAREGVG